jgi:EAL domain-containing protein (putative c-di-GMP-specific phosphodiesterase class I)/PAS domain-containing protein
MVDPRPERSEANRASSRRAAVAAALFPWRRRAARRQALTRDAAGRRFFSGRTDTPVGIVELDALGRITAADPVALELFAAPSLLGRSVLDVLVPPPGVRPDRHLAMLLGAHHPSTGFGRLASQAWDARTLDGRTFQVDCRVVRGDDGPSWHYELALQVVAGHAAAPVLVLDAEPAIDLREPLDDDRVVLRYRPILDLVTGHVTAVEAQAHLLCDDGTLLAPSEFPTIWERTGLLGRLGVIVVPQALRDLASLRAESGSGPLRVTVSIAPEELTASLATLVTATASRDELAASALEIEISEQAPLDAMPDAVEQLRVLRALGVGIVLADFGSGFTRLDLIADLPVDAVKIGGAFVRRMADSYVDLDIVETIIGVARRRSLALRADGVTSVEQAHALVRLGCLQAQGPLFGPPVDVEELRYLLREWRAVPAIATAMVKNR